MAGLSSCLPVSDDSKSSGAQIVPFTLNARREKTEHCVSCVNTEASLAAQLNAVLKTKPSSLTWMLLKCQASVRDVVGHLHHFCFLNNFTLPGINLCHHLMALVILV